MANEDKRVSAPQAQMSSGCRIAVNIVSLIVVIIASFAAGFASASLKEDRIHRTMLEDLRIHTASYNVDTFERFRNRMKGEGLFLRLHSERSHF